MARQYYCEATYLGEAIIVPHSYNIADYRGITSPFDTGRTTYHYTSNTRLSCGRCVAIYQER